MISNNQYEHNITDIMEPTLHMKQGLNLLDRVLKFYPMMREGDTSEVILTEQDWLVLMDFAENPETKSILPEQVRAIIVDRPTRTITVDTEDCHVAVKMGL